MQTPVNKLDKVEFIATPFQKGALSASAKKPKAPFIKGGGDTERIRSVNRGFAKRILTLISAITIYILPLASCTGISVQTENFFTMDTLGESTIISKSDSIGKEMNAKIKDICDEVEGRISNTIETSEIYKLNDYLKNEADHTSPFYLSDELAGLLNTAKNIKEATSGAYDPNLGEIIDLWDINNPDENAAHKLPEKDDFYPAVERVNEFQFSLSENDGGVFYDYNLFYPPKIDLGGIGKGYALDCVSDYLSRENMQNALVSFGSSILAIGKNKSGKLWTIGIKDPLDTARICGYVSATDKVVSVSGGYERFIDINGIDYCHILDPETGYPVDNDLLCTVVVMNAKSALQTQDMQEKFKNNGAISDALSTALYVMGKEKALKFYSSQDNKLDFEMILFVKSDSDPKGYEILSTNVIFTELGPLEGY